MLRTRRENGGFGSTVNAIGEYGRIGIRCELQPPLECDQMLSGDPTTVGKSIRFADELHMKRQVIRRLWMNPTREHTISTGRTRFCDVMPVTEILPDSVQSAEIHQSETLIREDRQFMQLIPSDHSPEFTHESLVRKCGFRRRQDGPRGNRLLGQRMLFV
jgi:hypothetical protein